MSKNENAGPPEHIEHIIIKFLQDEASPAEVDVLEGWLNEDQQHRKQFKEINKAFQAAVSLPRFNPKRIETAWSRFAGKIEEEQKADQKRMPRLSRYNLMRVAASVSILIVAGIVWRIYSGGAIMHQAFIQNAKSDRTKVVLPDSTVVWLNAYSTLEYGADFGKKSRNVSLKGEAFFDVTKSQQEFIVNTDNLSIHVKGTKFNVSTVRNGNEETTLEEGRVVLKVKGTTQSYDLKPGDQVTFNKNANKVILQQVKPSDYSVWKEEVLLLENLPLSDIVSKLEKRYNVKIDIDSAIAQRENLTMTIHEESIEEVLELIRLSSSLNYSIKGKEITLFE